MNEGNKMFSRVSSVSAHVFVAGIAIPLAVNFIIGFIFGIVEEFTKQAFSLEINLSLPSPVSIIVLMIVFWFGTKYWAKYFKKRFEVTSKKFALVSSCALLVLMCLYDVITNYDTVTVLRNSAVSVGFALGVIFMDIIIILPFYFATKKYIQKN